MELTPDHNLQGSFETKHEAPEAMAEEAPAELVQERVEALEYRLNALQEAGIQNPDVSEETRERVSRKAGLVAKALKFATLGAGIAGAYVSADYQATRYSISASKTESGALHFEHSDPETTRIMEYLTGEKPLPEADRVYFYREAVREELVSMAHINQKGYGIEELNRLEQELPTDEAGLRTKMTGLYKYWDNIMYGKEQGNYDARVTAAFTEIIQPPIPKYDPAFAATLWKIQAKVGAPRIRWSAPGSNLNSNLESSLIGAGRAHYNSEDNTVYLTPGAAGPTLISEDAHALQFDQRPVSSRVRFILDQARTTIASLRSGDTGYAEQFKQYKAPGTIEYEAHSVIEPELKSEMVSDYEARSKHSS